MCRRLEGKFLLNTAGGDFPNKRFQVDFHRLYNIWQSDLMLQNDLVSACIAAVFSSMFGSNAAIVLDNDLSLWFSVP